MYKAQVVQNTGIDWKKVKLTLSSGNPNQNNQAPTINPWFLRHQDTQLKAEPVGSGNDELREVVVTGLNKICFFYFYIFRLLINSKLNNFVNLSLP